MDLIWFKDNAFEKVLESVPLEEIIKDEYINLNKRSKNELKPIYDALQIKIEEINEKTSRFSRAPELDPKVVALLQENSKKLFPQKSKKEEEAHKKKMEIEKEKKRFENKRRFRDLQKKHITEKENLQNEVNYWNDKVEDNQLLLKHIGKPRGIVAGIIFIFVSIAFGIATPICFLPMQPENMTEGLRYLFLGGLFFILLYFTIYLCFLASTLDSDHY
jgi:hypothetical protein